MMNAIGLNPIKLDAIGLDPIRMNAIRLGVPVASSGSGRPYIDPELLSHVKMAISTWGKTNDDPDRAVLKDLTPNGNDMRLLNFGFAEGSGYGLPGTDFEGWLCTDGVDDMIVSEKTVDEMIGDSKECTVISIINYISDIGSDHVNVLGKRFIRNNMFERNGLNGKYYICGYTSSSINEIGNVTVVNDILGDKNDFTASYPTAAGVADYFSVIGYLDTNNVPRKCVKIAYAGGFIANKVLTTDEINQIIAYYNLDRPGQIIKPQLYYNIKKQGITNENHAEFNDQLIDFVGGHNIQLNNIGWEGESGINSYPVIFGVNKTWNAQGSKEDDKYYIYTSSANKYNITQIKISSSLFYSYIKRNGELTSDNKDIPSFKLKVTGLDYDKFYLAYYYLKSSDVEVRNVTDITSDGIYELPKSFASDGSLTETNSYIGLSFIRKSANIPDVVKNVNVTIEVLPTIEHALCLDGINDFGKVTGLPVLKDYTICALRKWLYGDSATSVETGSIVSKSKANQGAFILEQTLSLNPTRCGTWNFGTFNALTSDDKLNEESFTYQTKYSYNGNPIQAGAGIDSDSMWLGTIRDGDSRFSKLALWSLILFPYSLSEFLLERQLRKYKAGTLYPDMIEFRPIVKSNIPYSSISYSVNPGVYVTEGSTVTITITLSNASDKLIGVSSNAISDISISGDNGVYEVTGKVTKSPQKISIVISSYLTMLGNETLISNETLIKNE
ncbi:hypothetical protein [Bacteroides faecis]|uniref:hypothetical protein n=4 Tax=Bacteroides faecis TaxID=674529 RepID=UPI0034A39032